MKPRFANVGNPALRQLYLGDAEPYTPPAEELVIPLNERKSIQTLTEACCRWPIGDPQLADFHFCGRKKVTGLPYCEFHARRAFQPPQPRRRDREVFAPGVVVAPGTATAASVEATEAAQQPAEKAAV
jgi:GcrA cell cycle regulator